MKAIGIKMVDLQPMTAREANDKGHKIGEHSFETEGYEVTYPDGYKSWSPKEVADAAYFPIKDENGDTIKPQDIDNLIVDCYSVKVGTKNTNTTVVTRTGFEVHGQSGCVKAENFDLAIGEQYAKPKALDQLWFAMGFVLQWAKYGLKQKPVISKYPAHIERVIAEHDELRERSVKLANFISGNEIFKTLSENEQNDMKDQLIYMQKYIDCLHSRLIRSGVDASDI